MKSAAISLVVANVYRVVEGHSCMTKLPARALFFVLLYPLSTMKRLLTCLFLLLGSPLLAWAQGTSAKQAVDADHRCAIEHIYRSVQGLDSAHQTLAQAVDHCVTFERGAAAWYLRKTERDRSVSSSESSAALQWFKASSVQYLRRAVPHCQQAQADESQCLALLKL